MRKYSALIIAKLIPANIIYDIIILLRGKKNGKEIISKLKENYPEIPNYIAILKFMDSIRKIIAQHLKYFYNL